MTVFLNDLNLQFSAHWQWLVMVAVAVFGLVAEWRLRVRNTLWARVLPPLMSWVLLHSAILLAGSSANVGFNLLRGAAVLALTLLISRVCVYALRQIFHTQHTAGAQVFALFERWIALVLWAIAALVITGAGQLAWQKAKTIEFGIGKTVLNVADIVSATLAAAITLLLALWLSALIERRLHNASSLDANTRVVLGRFAKAALLTVGVVSALALGGIDLTLLGVLFGALGVGLGFGLQKIAASYVSGFIVLLDKGVKLGDLITVDKYHGRVTHIHARYTVVQTFDAAQALIPNEVLISTPVVNYSYQTNAAKVRLEITVAYSSDLEWVLQRLEHHARVHKRVVIDPAPSALLTRFADDGLALELHFWIADPENGRANVRSDIARAIWADFKAAGIELPYPQRVVHMTGASPSAD